MRVTVVSDSHLSSSSPETLSNREAVLGHGVEVDPALVVHLGDLTLDGATRPEDLAPARHQLRRLAAPWKVVPGSQDCGAWTMLAVDAQLFGSGSPPRPNSGRGSRR